MCCLLIYAGIIAAVAGEGDIENSVPNNGTLDHVGPTLPTPEALSYLRPTVIRRSHEYTPHRSRTQNRRDSNPTYPSRYQERSSPTNRAFQERLRPFGNRRRPPSVRRPNAAFKITEPLNTRKSEGTLGAFPNVNPYRVTRGPYATSKEADEYKWGYKIQERADKKPRSNPRPGGSLENFALSKPRGTLSTQKPPRRHNFPKSAKDFIQIKSHRGHIQHPKPPGEYNPRKSSSEYNAPFMEREVTSNSYFDSGLDLAGTLQSALNSLWNYKRLAYQTLLARSTATDRPSYLTPGREGDRWTTTWSPPDEGLLPNQEFGDDLLDSSSSFRVKTSMERQEDEVGDYPSAYRGISPGDYESGWERPPINAPVGGGNLSPRQEPYPPLSYLEDSTSVKTSGIRNRGSYRRRGYSTEGQEESRYGRRSVIPRDFTGSGNRMPRMQLVRFNKRISVDGDEPKAQDITVVNVTLIEDDQGTKAPKEYYAHYADDVSGDNDLPRNRIDDEEGENYYSYYYYDDDEEEEEEEPLLGSTTARYETEPDSNQSDKYDLHEDDYLVVEYIDDDEDEVDYVDNYYYYDYDDDVDERRGDDLSDQDYADLLDFLFDDQHSNLEDSSLNDDSTLSNRQGLFNLPIFGGKRKKPFKRKRVRPSPPPRFQKPPAANGSSPNTSEGTKNIRVRIYNKKNPRKKRIRMKIRGVKPPKEGSNKAPSIRVGSNYNPLVPQSSGDSTGYSSSPFGRPHPQEGYSNQPNFDRGDDWYTHQNEQGYLQISNAPTKNTNTEGFFGQKWQGLKGSMGWSALNQMSSSLPDLSKAITVMSFIAFSVFVANLGVNALANSSLGVSFGRDGPDQFFANPNFNVDDLIQDLDKILEPPKEEQENPSDKTTFKEMTEFVVAIYNSLYETTKNEMMMVQEKIANFLSRDFSKDDLPLAEVSRGFLSERADGGESSYEELGSHCYRKLLCLSHNLTRTYRSHDYRNRLLPFWTFGIGWFKNGKSDMVNLLENLRAELAGETGRNCSKLFEKCSQDKKLNAIITELESELTEKDSELESQITIGSTENSLPRDTTYKSLISSTDK